MGEDTANSRGICKDKKSLHPVDSMPSYRCGEERNKKKQQKEHKIDWIPRSTKTQKRKGAEKEKAFGETNVRTV